jgi:hypothetical protein
VTQHGLQVFQRQTRVVHLRCERLTEAVQVPLEQETLRAFLSAALLVFDAADNRAFDIQHSYYWRRGGHLIDTKSEASAQKLPMHPGLRDGLLEWRSQARRFRLSFGEAQGSQATRFGRRAEKEDTAGVPEDWHHRRRLAYVPAHSWNDASRDGRTSTHDPRLLTAQQPSRHEQVPAGDIEDQASGARQVGRRILACGLFAQIQSGPVGDAMPPIRSSEFASGAYRPLISPDSFRSGLVSD